MFTIRRATLQDVDELVELRFQLFRETGELQTTPPVALLEATQAYLRQHLPTGQFLSWVAQAQDRIIGTSGVVFLEKPPTNPNPSGLEAHVMNMYTRPEWRHQGVATAIIEELIRSLKTTPVRRIWLRTTPDGVHVYERAGFIRTQDELEITW